MIEAEIDGLLSKLERESRLTPTVNLYAEGVKVKLTQARWSLDILSEIENTPNIEGSTSSQNAWGQTSTNDKIVFFCECFWDFLRSSLDITAQLINELRSLGRDEMDVSFYKVFRQVETNMAATSLFQALKSCERNWAFRELNAYRHCSTHRRQVYIFEQESEAREGTVTRGYEYVGGSRTITLTRYLCANTSSLRPRRSFKRPIVEYNRNILEAIERRMITIIRSLP